MKRFIGCCAILLGSSAVAFAQGAGTQPKSASEGQVPQTPQFEESLEVRPSVPEQITVAGSPSDFFLTFTHPVRVPGATLTPGTYVFRFPLGSGTDVIQVMPADRSAPLAMFETTPIDNTARDMASAGEVVLHAPPTQGAPLVMRELYLPGQRRGYEFLPADSAS